MRVFVAGASGVVGRTLLPMLVEAGHDVTAMTRDPAKLDSLREAGAKTVLLDVFDREAVLPAVQTARPDVVIDQLTELRARDFAANARVRIEGSRNLIDAARAAGVPRLITESYCIYASGPGLADEDSPLDRESQSARRSLAGIEAVERTAAEMPEAIVLRYGTFYGPGTFYARDGWVAEQLRKGKMVATDDITSFLEVQDAARAALLALSWPPGTFNIVDDDPAPGTEWLPLFADIIGAPSPPVRHVSHGSRGVSHARAKRVLGWQPLFPSWRDGFRRAL